MSLLAMPFLIINYGGEMIYILEQRLHSQQIKAEKAHRVLHDLTRALFNEDFIKEMFRPQALYSPDQTRDVCDKLAQSSIMKLSTDSMDKLFDLVVMGVKYQIMSARHPTELVDITLNHIDYIAKLGRQNSTTSDAILGGRKQFVQFAKTLRVSEYAQVRQSLLDFSIKKRVKVSLFLQEKMQHNDGRFVIAEGGALPNDLIKMPGTIRYDNGATESFEYPLAHCTKPPFGGDPYDPDQRTCMLGQNFYTIDRKKPAAPAATKDAPAVGPSAATTSATLAKGACCAGTAELNSLGALLGVSSEVPKAQVMDVNLFGEPQDAGASPSASTEVITIPQMKREELERCNPELFRVMDGMDVGGSGSQQPDDLTDLLDQAGQ